MSLDPAIANHVDAHLSHFVELLSRLVAQPSVSAQGIGITETVALVTTLLEDAGLTVERHATGGNPVLLAKAAGESPRRVLFYDHYDVQPPEPLELWESPPFEPTVRDGKLFGRGVSDNKGNLAARIAALLAFRAVRGTLPAGVTFLVEGEEEIGSPNLAPFVESHREDLRADGCIWETGGVDFAGAPIFTLGCKGMLCIELAASGAKTDLHSSLGTVVPNPAWRLVWALATIKDSKEDIHVPGWNEHTIPPSPAELALVDALPDDTAQQLVNLNLERFVLGLTGAAYRRRLLFGTSCTINGLIAGYTGPGIKTVLPNQARAKLDFRLVPGQQPDDLLRKLRAHLDDRGFADVQIEAGDGTPAARSDPDSPFIQTVLAAARDVYPVAPVVSPTMTGTGPMYLFTETLGLPVTSLGCSNPDSRNHAPNENIRLEDYRLAILHASALLDRLGEN